MGCCFGDGTTLSCLPLRFMRSSWGDFRGVGVFKPKELSAPGLITCLVISSRNAENCSFPFTKLSLAASIVICLDVSVTCTLVESTSIDLAFLKLLPFCPSSLFFRIPLLGSWIVETAFLGTALPPSVLLTLPLKARLCPKLAVL